MSSSTNQTAVARRVSSASAATAATALAIATSATASAACSASTASLALTGLGVVRDATDRIFLLLRNVRFDVILVVSEHRRDESVGVSGGVDV